MEKKKVSLQIMFGWRTEKPSSRFHRAKASHGVKWLGTTSRAGKGSSAEGRHEQGKRERKEWLVLIGGMEKRHC